MHKSSKQHSPKQVLKKHAVITKAPQAKLAHTILQAATVCGLSRSALYVALKQGKLRARKAGRRTLVEDSELRRFVKALPALGGAA